MSEKFPQSKEKISPEENRELKDELIAELIDLKSWRSEKPKEILHSTSSQTEEGQRWKYRKAWFQCVITAFNMIKRSAMRIPGFEFPDELLKKIDRYKDEVISDVRAKELVDWEDIKATDKFIDEILKALEEK